MSLGPMGNSNGGGMTRSNSGNGGNGGGGGSMHTPNQGLINSPTRNSYTSPSYGQQNSQSPYVHHPSYGSSSGQFNGMSNGGGYPPHDPMGILRPVGNRPQSPLNLSGIRGVGNAVGISTLLPNNGGNSVFLSPTNLPTIAGNAPSVPSIRRLPSSL